MIIQRKIIIHPSPLSLTKTRCLKFINFRAFHFFLDLRLMNVKYLSIRLVASGQWPITNGQWPMARRHGYMPARGESSIGQNIT